MTTLSIKPYIKIRAGLSTGLHPIELSSAGIIFNPDFQERLYEVEDDFRSKIIVPINDAIGLNNWAIKFIEVPDDEPRFFADIYVDNNDDFLNIIAIIQTKINDVKFHYYNKGNVATYIDS
jgi:hypothetical protein